jgi:probable rRNA maturation factor
LLQVHINVGNFVEADVPALERAVLRTLGEEGATEAEVSLTLLDDPAIREMNLQYLDRDSVTDVISFSLYEAGEPVLGDVYVGYPQALRQADALGIDPGEEMLRLAVHGVLHVLGHDHPEGEDRSTSPMFQRQEEIVRLLLDSGP